MGLFLHFRAEAIRQFINIPKQLPLVEPKPGQKT